MFAQSLRASRFTLTRCLRQPIAARRTFITSAAIRQADIVKDIYIRELTAYKPAPIKLTDAEGQVKQWKAPAPPSAPTEGTQGLANELAAYEAQEVEVEGATTTEGGAIVAEQDWFEEDIEDEPAKH
ncbi:mitochondrial F1F0 ATP synthase-like protein subunit Atp14 [Terfezia claveryi]|nr:mitochondrial F1F0 ATP synthase-like protein subunit Atp14 [Terfezia claveryi]